MFVYLELPGLLVRELGAPSSYHQTRCLETSQICSILIPREADQERGELPGQREVTVLPQPDGSIEVHFDAERLRQIGTDPNMLALAISYLDLSQMSEDNASLSESDKALVKARMIVETIESLPAEPREES